MLTLWATLKKMWKCTWSCLSCVYLVGVVLSLFGHWFSYHCYLLSCEYLAVKHSLGLHEVDSVSVSQCCKAFSSGNRTAYLKSRMIDFAVALYIRLRKPSFDPFFNWGFQLLCIPFACCLLGSGGVNAIVEVWTNHPFLRLPVGPDFDFISNFVLFLNFPGFWLLCHLWLTVRSLCLGNDRTQVWNRGRLFASCNIV